MQFLRKGLYLSGYNGEAGRYLFVKLDSYNNLYVNGSVELTFSEAFFTADPIKNAFIISLTDPQQIIDKATTASMYIFYFYSDEILIHARAASYGTHEIIETYHADPTTGVFVLDTREESNGKNIVPIIGVDIDVFAGEFRLPIHARSSEVKYFLIYNMSDTVTTELIEELLKHRVNH